MNEIFIKSDWTCVATIYLVVYGNESNRYFRTTYVTKAGAEKYAADLRKKYKFVEVSEIYLFND